MGVQSEGKPSNVKPYRHPHYQERFQGRQEDRYQHYQGRRWNTHQYSWNRASQNHYSIDIIRDQQLLQIGEVTTTIHGIKGKKIMQQPTIKD
jgi:hypothetical protein